MFDREVQQHAELLAEIGRRHHSNMAAILSIDCSNVGWAPNGSSGGEAGRFDYEGNGLLITPTWAMAKDKFISNPWLSGAKGAAQPQIHIFFNSKSNPGIPFSITTALATPFGDFAGACCNFRCFYVHVSTAKAGIIQPLLVLKGMDLSGLGSSFRSSSAEIAGCYSCGEGSEPSHHV